MNCPNCHRSTGLFSVVCRNCGHEFTHSDRMSELGDIVSGSGVASARKSGGPFCLSVGYQG